MEQKAILWGRGSSLNVQKVLWVTHDLGIPVDHRPIGGSFGGNDEPWFRAMNPNGTVPVWQEGDFSLYESQAIIRYLARRKPGLYGNNPQDMAVVDCWLDWFAITFWPPVRLLFVNVWREQQLSRESEQARAAHQACEANLVALAQRLDLAGHIALPVFSLADIVFTIGLNRLKGLDLGSNVPATVVDWHNRQCQRPGFAHATVDEPDLPGHAKGKAL